MVTATAVCCCRPTFCSAATAAEPSSKAIPALPASKAPRVRSRMEMHSSSVTVEGDGGAQAEPGFRRNSGVARQNLAPPPDTPKVAPQPAGRCMSGSSGPGVGGGMARPAFVEDETDRLSPWLWAGATLLALATLSL